MDSRIYRGQSGVFQCAVVKLYHFNNVERFTGRSHTRSAPILIDDEKEWEVEAILDFNEWHDMGQFLVRWKGSPNSENSWELVEGLEKGEDLVQEW